MEGGKSEIEPGEKPLWHLREKNIKQMFCLHTVRGSAKHPAVLFLHFTSRPLPSPYNWLRNLQA